MAKVSNIDERRPVKQPPQMAPYPAIDRFPTVIGQGLSLAYVSAVFRLCLTGYRQQYVDLINELLEKDPHGYSVVTKRVLTVGGGSVDIEAPEDLKPGGEREVAEECAQWVQGEINQIPDLQGALVRLAWATFNAVAVLEKMIVEREGGALGIADLRFVHPRRLSYPDPWKWDLYIWDQGLVLGPEYGMAPTQGVYGLNTTKFPGKFVVHTPQVRGDYPTREGLGRQIAYWMCLKMIATRLAPQYLERFAIPFADIEFNTKSETDNGPSLPRDASPEDISNAEAAARAVGAGALSHWVHPDSVALKFQTPDVGTAKLTFPEWIELCNAEESKAVLGATLTTEIGSSGGNRAASETQKKGEQKLYEFDAGALAATLKRDVSDWLVENNPKYKNLPRRLYPQVKVHVNEDPTATEIIANASEGAKAGLPVDADQIGQRANVPLVPNPNPKQPRRMLPLAPIIVKVANEELGLHDPPEPPTPPPGLVPPGAQGAPPGEEPDPKAVPPKGKPATPPNDAKAKAKAPAKKPKE